MGLRIHDGARWAPALVARCGLHAAYPRGSSVADFVSFHATPRPPALLNLVTDCARGTPLKNRDIVLLATTTRRLVANGVTVVVADRHPLSRQALFERGAHGLRMLDWVTLRSGNFSAREPRKSFKTPIPPNFANERGFVSPRKTRAGAEILALGSVPLAAVSAVVCSADLSDLKDMVRTATSRPRVPVKARRRAFFRAGD